MLLEALSRAGPSPAQECHQTHEPSSEDGANLSRDARKPGNISHHSGPSAESDSAYAAQFVQQQNIEEATVGNTDQREHFLDNISIPLVNMELQATPA